MKLYESWNRWRFQRQIRSIDSTPPIERGELAFVTLSMVHRRDVLPYVLALKSFHRLLPAQRVIVIADPTLGPREQAVIQRHVPFVEIYPAERFRVDGIPTGGCWERLIAVSRFVQEAYVVQLDADTVAFGEMPEVRDAIEEGIAFSLATDDRFQDLIECERMAAWAKPRLGEGGHIQVVAEACLDRLEGSGLSLYARGCAGFAGYPQRSFDEQQLLTVSRRMAELMGARWTEWGTEQFTSNLLVANMPGAGLLPHRRYSAPHRRTPDTRFLHFIGYVRFVDDSYTKSARQIGRLLAGDMAASS